MSLQMPSIVENWTHATADIPERGLDVTRKASPAECAEIARNLEILGLESLEAAYRITARARGRFHLEGTLRSVVVQACVVTLDPVRTSLQDRIDVEFRPPGELLDEAGSGEEELGVLEAPEYEPIENKHIAAGRVVLETLAAALPSHPRVPDAALDKHEAKPAVPSAGPLAALANWKPKKD